MQYTDDFKRGIVRALIASGMSRKEFADKAEIGVGTLKRWVAQYKDEEVPKVDRKKY
ncbi:transposase, partial [Anaerostipes sp.]|uniref:transposase n=1 Tax=Anaerostipes sp. TaxID=1872530 RepID=UPI003967D3E0